MRPEQHFLWADEVEGLSSNTSTTDGRSSSSGRNGVSGSSAGRANNHVRSSNNGVMDSSSSASSDTNGWGQSVQEGGAVGRQRGSSEAWSHGTNRSTTRGQTTTNSRQFTNGYSDTVGHTNTHGFANTNGKTITRGESVTVSPFHEYEREEIASPVFMTPEEQKLLVQQRLSHIPKMHFLVKAPESQDCIVRAPFVRDPLISARRLAAGLESVYTQMPCYTTLNQQSCDAHAVCDDHGGDEVIDVVAVQPAQLVRALPSPAPTDAETEAALWERWHSMSRGHREK